jgi:two-component system sensor histidine kinase KdpD
MLTNPNHETRLARAYPFSLVINGNEAAQDRRIRSALLDAMFRDVVKPLALIAGAAGGLRSRSVGAPPGSTADELIGVIEHETARLEGFVAILLALAKLESDALEIRPQAAVSLKEVIGSAVVDAAKTLWDRRVRVNVSPDTPALRLDPAILRRALILLIENAARQTPRNSTVVIQAARDATVVRIQVMDEGEGIPPGDLAGIFDQFHLRSRSGAGVHLTVCEGYINALGGKISAANRTDRSGAVFTITFPLPSEHH